MSALDGTIETIAGTGSPGCSSDGLPAAESRLSGPEGVAVDREGNVFVADSGNHRICRIDARSGVLTTIAGTGSPGFDGLDGPAFALRLNHPSGVAVDDDGRVYCSDYGNDVIRRIDADGRMTSAVGTGRPGYSGDGGPGADAEVSDVYGIAIAAPRHLYFVDSLNFAVRRLDGESGTVETVLGLGYPGPVVEFAPAATATLGGHAHAKGEVGAEVPHGVDVDARGNVFVAETGIRHLRMLDVAADRYYTIAGNGEPGLAAEGAPALESPVELHGVRVDAAGNVYYVDFGHHVVNVIRF